MVTSMDNSSEELVKQLELAINLLIIDIVMITVLLIGTLMDGLQIKIRII